MYIDVVLDKWVKIEGQWLLPEAPYVLQMVIKWLILWNFTGLWYFLLISILQIERDCNSYIEGNREVIQF